MLWTGTKHIVRHMQVRLYKYMPATKLPKGLWPTFIHLVHTNATRGGYTGSNIFPTTLLAYHIAIYQQGMTSELGN